MFKIHCVFHDSTFSKRHRISFIDYQHSMNRCTITLNVEHQTSMLIKGIVESRCLTRTSDNSKYFLWSHRLRVNEFQLYILSRIVCSGGFLLFVLSVHLLFTGTKILFCLCISCNILVASFHPRVAYTIYLHTDITCP